LISEWVLENVWWVFMVFEVTSTILIFVKSNFKAIIIMMLVSVLQNYDNSSWDYQIHVLSNSGYSVVEFEQIDIVPQ
jgi:hypothetical protein